MSRLQQIRKTLQEAHRKHTGNRNFKLTNNNSNNLSGYRLITSKQYVELNSKPEFVGQTTPNEDGFYHMCWKTETGELVSTRQNLFR